MARLKWSAGTAQGFLINRWCSTRPYRHCQA